MRRKMIDADKRVCRIIEPRPRGDPGCVHFDKMSLFRELPRSRSRRSHRLTTFAFTARVYPTSL
jgi:hypothetical protein